MMVHRSGPAVGVPKMQPTVATSALAPQVGGQVLLLNCNFVHCIHHSEDYQLLRFVSMSKPMQAASN